MRIKKIKICTYLSKKYKNKNETTHNVIKNTTYFSPNFFFFFGFYNIHSSNVVFGYSFFKNLNEIPKYIGFEEQRK